MGAITARAPSVTSGGAALRSALVPGWGQWAARHRRRGAAILVVTLLLLSVVALTVLGLVRGLLPLPPLLSATAGLVGELPLRALDRVLAGNWTFVWRAFLGVNLVVALLRAWIAVDAARLARWTPRGAEPPLRAARGAAGAAAALLVLGAPHLALVMLGVAARPLVSQVFIAPPASAAAQSSKTPAASAPVQSVDLPDPDSGRPAWDGVSRLNVLLMGVDRRPNQLSDGPRGNSDTLLVVSIDPATQSSAMISIPRDVFLNIPGIGQEKINAAYREVGPELSVRVVSDLINQPIHRWASIEIPAFAKTIDAVGGVLVDVERPIRDDEYPADNFAIRRIYLPAGLQWLSGEEALWYARSRHGSNDFDRAARQQALLLALKERARDRRLFARVPALIQSAADALQTDLAPRELLALARLAGSTDFRSARLVLTPPAFGSEINQPNLYAIVPNVPRIRAAVAETFAGTPAPSVQSPLLLGESVPAQGGGGDDYEPDAPPDEGVDIP